MTHRQRPDLTARLRLVAFASAALTAAACSPQSGAELPPPTGRDLCRVDLEVDYFLSRGDGSIQVVEDNNAPAPAVALIQDGQRYVILNPTILAGFPAALRELILAHEIGHHYLGGGASIRSEFTADAFASRVVAFQHGGTAQVEAAARYMEQDPRPGDATHAPDEVRAAYIREVYRALFRDPEACAPPAPEATGGR